MSYFHDYEHPLLILYWEDA